MTLKVKHVKQIEVIFETASDYESGDQVGSTHHKNPETIPLRIITLQFYFLQSVNL
jgi:hypothetical protein